MSGDPTIYDVADAAGVSAATVSRVMKGSRLIGEESRKKVLQAVRKLGYVPRQVRRQRERAILNVKLVLPHHESGLKRLFYDFSELADGLREGLAPCEVNLMADVVRRGFDPFPHKKGGEIDAFVFAFQTPPERVIRRIRESGARVVILNRVVRGVPCVVGDNLNGMQQLADHLYRRGVRKGVAFLGYRGIRDILDERRRGFARACRDLGIDFEAARNTTVFESPEEIEPREIEKVLGGGISTLVCVNDVLAAVVLMALRELSLEVPGEVRVTGFDDSPVRGLVRPVLTTVSMPVADLARHAGKQLQAALVDQEEMASAMRVSGRLLAGQTT